MSFVKYRLKEVAADFGVTPKEIGDIISKFYERPKSNSQVLTDQELNAVFEVMTQTHQIDSLEQVFAAQKPKEEPKKEVKAEPSKAEKTEASKAEKAEAPKAEKAEQPAAAQSAQSAKPEKTKEPERKRERRSQRSAGRGRLRAVRRGQDRRFRHIAGRPGQLRRDPVSALQGPEAGAEGP